LVLKNTRDLEYAYNVAIRGNFSLTLALAL